MWVQEPEHLGRCHHLLLAGSFISQAMGQHKAEPEAQDESLLLSRGVGREDQGASSPEIWRPNQQGADCSPPPPPRRHPQRLRLG